MTGLIPIPRRLLDATLAQLEALLSIHDGDNRLVASRRRLVKYVIHQLERRRDQAAGKKGET